MSAVATMPSERTVDLIRAGFTRSPLTYPSIRERISNERTPLGREQEEPARSLRRTAAENALFLQDDTVLGRLCQPGGFRARACPHAWGGGGAIADRARPSVGRGKPRRSRRPARARRRALARWQAGRGLRTAPFRRGQLHRHRRIRLCARA